MAEMLETLETYIKLAVDIEREILAGGGVNIRPGQGNRSLEIQDPGIRNRVERITRDWLGGGG
jgi:hypothetical protein